MSFQKLKKIIEEILANNVQARNDDKLLTFTVLRRIKYPHYETFDFDNLIVQRADLEKFPALESVKRIRATIQNREKRFLPTEQVAQLRRKKQQKIKQMAQAGLL